MMTKHIIDNFYLQKHKYILFSGLACNRGQYYELHMYLCIVYTLYVCNKYNVGPYYVHWIRDLLQPFFFCSDISDQTHFLQDIMKILVGR